MDGHELIDPSFFIMQKLDHTLSVWSVEIMKRLKIHTLKLR